MIQALFLTLTIACGLSCVAESGQHFIRTLGSFEMEDATNHAVITTAKSSDNKLSVAVKWRSEDGVTTGILKPLTREGWFIYGEDASHVWVFTGEVLNLVHNEGKNVSDESSPEVDRICPKSVRDALPEDFRKKHFP